MAGVHLAVKVQQLLLAQDAGDEQLYCVLSTGSARFAAGKGTLAAAQTFLITPWELSHAEQKPLPANAAPSPAKAHAATSSGSAAASSTSAVLVVELFSAKRWGADALVAAGELLLAPYLALLQPNEEPGVDVKVVLAKAGGKGGGASRAAAKGPQGSSGPGGGGGGGSGAAAAAAAAAAGGGSDAASAGDGMAVVLQLATLTAPAVPMHLLGPVGSGRGEVPPRFCADATWVPLSHPVLHTSAGHLYQQPAVQLLRVTLHKAAGLHNLHVDPHAAAAAASAMSRLAAGGSPSTTERARAAANRAVQDGTTAGRNLLQKTTTWFGRSKSSAGVASAAAAAVAGALAASKSSAGLAGSGRAPEGSTGDLQAAAGAGTRAGAGGGGGAGGGTASGGAVADGANAAAIPPDPSSGSGPGQQQHQQFAAAAAAGAEAEPAAGGGGPAGDGSGSGGSDGGDAHSHLDSGSGSGGSSSAPGPGPAGAAGPSLLPSAPSPHTPPLGLTAAAAEAVAEDAARAAAAAAEDTLGGLGAAAARALADPVSRLKQATRHTRSSSVDAEAVMAALEDNGFHATDAPGGAFFYARLSLAFAGPQEAGGAAAEGAAGGAGGGGGGNGGVIGSSSSGSSGGSSVSHISRVVGLGPGGEAAWEEGFWLPLVRPAPLGAVLELELFAAKDDKTRGKPVALARAPLHQLLSAQQPAQQSHATTSDGAAPPWLKAHHVLTASFSDHLHCTLSLTLEAADWDLRADWTGVPRALAPAAAAAAAAAAALAGTGASSTGSAAGPAVPSSAATSAPDAASAADRPHRAAALGSSASGQGTAAAAAAGGGAAAGAAAVTAATAQTAVLSGSSWASGVQPIVPQLPCVASLDVVVKAFDTRKPLDVFFVLLVGPYCLVSSNSHSTHHHHWGWHLRLPVADPADLLTLVLFAREDQAGGRKRVGAAMLTMFSGSIKLVGKLRLRLSTLTANRPLNLSMPLQGERTNLRAGQASAATAHLYLHLVVPRLLGTYLPSYVRFSTCSPGLYLLASSPGVAGPDSSLEALGSEVQTTTARWLEQQPPMLPAKVFRKVQDDGRGEFTLSRTRANWRRLTLLREATAPAQAAFAHLCSWENTAHSVACYAVILLLGVFPSKVLSLLLLVAAASLLRGAWAPQKPAAPGAPPSASPTPSAAAAAAVPPAAPSGVPAAVVAGSFTGGTGAGAGSGLLSWLLPQRLPPAMWDPAFMTAEEGQTGSSVPSDPYTSLKQNYEAVIGFLTLVQNVIDGWAAAGERLQFAFSWTDQLATGALLVLMLLLALGLWVLGLQVLVTIGLLWVFRHPILRDPLPPPPVNFVVRLPTRSDTMM